VGTLKALLPIAALEQANHKFTIRTPKHRNRQLRSVIHITGTNDLLPWQILARHEAILASYKVVVVEIAFDVDAKSVNDAHDKLFALVKQLTKPRHFRKYVLIVHEPEQKLKPGYVSKPTFYFEDRSSSVRLKCYCRYLKLKDGRFGGPCVRLEWTLKGKAAIQRHLGGNKIKNLTTDLNKFLKDNLQLEKVDYVALEKLVRSLRLGGKNNPASVTAKPKTVSELYELYKDPAYRSERACYLMLRNFAYDEQEAGRLKDWKNELWTLQHSPAQLRGYLRRLQQIELLRAKRSRLTSAQRKGLRKPGRPRRGRTVRRAISNYRINRCFKRIQLQHV